MVSRGSIGGGSQVLRDLWAARRTIAAAVFVSAAAAMLALLLVAPRYEASARIAAEPYAEVPSPAANLLALALSVTFTHEVVADDARDGEVWATVLQRIASVADGTYRSDPGVPPAVRLREVDGEGLVVEARANSPEVALQRVSATVSELRAHVGGTGTDPAAATDTADEIRAREALLTEMNARLAVLSEAASTDSSAADRRTDLVGSLGETDETLADREIQLETVAALVLNPYAEIASDRIEDENLQRLVTAYGQLAPAVERLEGELPAENPRLRIASLRLNALRVELAEAATVARDDVESEIASARDRRDALAGEIDRLDDAIELSGRRTGEIADLSERIRQGEERLASLSETVEAPPASAYTLGATEPASVRSVPPPYGPVAFVAALAGLLAAMGGTLVQSLLMRRDAIVETHDEPAAPMAAAVPPPEIASETAPSEVDGRPEAARETISFDEAVAALSANRVSRTLVVPLGDPSGPPASLRLARALATEGQLVLLLDLSSSQDAIRAAGLMSGIAGFGDVVKGTAGLPAVTRSDGESAVDIVSAGADTGSEEQRAEKLRFLRRAYDQVLVECNGLRGAQIARLVDDDCAVLLVGAAGEQSEVADRRLREIDAAGLDAAILRA